MTTPPGWYPDPATPFADGTQRWWDGTRWTEHTSRTAPPAPPGPYSPTPAFGASDAPVRRRSRASVLIASIVIAALVLVGGGFVVATTLLGGAALGGSSGSSTGVVVGSEGRAGEPNGDAPRVEVYLDLMCPYCAQFEDANAADLTDLREAGDVTVVYHLISILDSLSQGTRYSTRAANAALTVADQAPESFVPFVEALFADQPAEQTGGLTDAELRALAVGVGVSGSVADTFTELRHADDVEQATLRAQRAGVSGTPTVLFDGERVPADLNYLQPGALGTWLEEQTD